MRLVEGQEEQLTLVQGVLVRQVIFSLPALLVDHQTILIITVELEEEWAAA